MASGCKLSMHLESLGGSQYVRFISQQIINVQADHIY